MTALTGHGTLKPINPERPSQHHIDFFAAEQKLPTMVAVTHIIKDISSDNLHIFPPECHMLDGAECSTPCVELRNHPIGSHRGFFTYEVTTHG
jgi:hypothetical protein